MVPDPDSRLDRLISSGSELRSDEIEQSQLQQTILYFFVTDSSKGFVSRECGGGFEFMAGHRMADVDPTFGMQWNITRGQCSSMCDNIQVKL